MRKNWADMSLFQKAQYLYQQLKEFTERVEKLEEKERPKEISLSLGNIDENTIHQVFVTTRDSGVEVPERSK